MLSIILLRPWGWLRPPMHRFKQIYYLSGFLVALKMKCLGQHFQKVTELAKLQSDSCILKQNCVPDSNLQIGPSQIGYCASLGTLAWTFLATEKHNRTTSKLKQIFPPPVGNLPWTPCLQWRMLPLVPCRVGIATG